MTPLDRLGGIDAAVDKLQSLIESGGEAPQVLNKSVSPKGLTALFKAIRVPAHVRIIKLLLEAGSDPT